MAITLLHKCECVKTLGVKELLCPQVVHTLCAKFLIFYLRVLSCVILPSCLLVCLPPQPQEFVSTLGSNKVDHLIIIIIDIILENIIFAKALLKRNSVQLKLSTANN